jgi:hypothetical protein
LDAGKAVDLVDCIEQHETENLADPGPRLQQGEGMGIVVFGSVEAREGPIGKKGATYAAFFRGATNVWGVSPWIVADG